MKTALDHAFAEEIRKREARLEKISCFVVMAVAFSCTSLFLIARPVAGTGLYGAIGAVVGGVILCFSGLVISIQCFGYFRAAKWINVFLQVSCVTSIIWLDQHYQGPVYALSSMPPLFYALVIGLTGFRLQATLTFFAGAVTVAQFAWLYFGVLLPQLSAETLQQIPSLSPSITIMKFLVLGGVSVACGISALQLQRTVRGKVDGELRQAELQRLFGRYVSPEVASEVVAAGSDLLKPRLMRAVILFGDLRGFTAYADQRSPAEVAETLNGYFEIACRVVESEGGVVNKFLGDGFLALFGVPVALDDAPFAAARAALRLTEEITPLLEAKGLSVGVALHEGEVIAGEIGSGVRCEFTVIGQAVNVAARLEGMNRILGTKRIVSAELASKINSRFVLRALGGHEIRGLREKVEIFELGSAGL